MEGSTAVWQAIKAACEAILDGDKELALALLEASCITVQDESMEQCFDERGRGYTVPSFLFTHPRPEKSKQTGGTNILDRVMNGMSGIKEEPLVLQVRVNPGEVKMEINATTTDSVATLKILVMQYVASKSSDSDNKLGISSCEVDRQRVMFLGKELNDDQYLGNMDFEGSKVIQIFLRPVQTISDGH